MAKYNKEELTIRSDHTIINSINRVIDSAASAASTSNEVFTLVGDNFGVVPAYRLTKMTSSDASVTFAYTRDNNGPNTLDIVAAPTPYTSDLWNIITDFPSGEGTTAVPIGLNTLIASKGSNTSIQLNFQNVAIETLVLGKAFKILFGRTTTETPGTFPAIPVILSLGAVAGKDSTGLIYGNTVATESVIFSEYGDSITLMYVDSPDDQLLFTVVEVTGNPIFN